MTPDPENPLGLLFWWRFTAESRDCRYEGSVLAPDKNHAIVLIRLQHPWAIRVTKCEFIAPRQ